MEKTGIALSEPAYFYVSGNPDEGGSVGLTFLLDDGEAFAELMNGIVNHDKKDGTASLNVSSEDGISKISEKGDRVVFLYNEEKFVYLSQQNPKKLFKEPNDFEVFLFRYRTTLKGLLSWVLPWIMTICSLWVRKCPRDKPLFLHPC